MESRRRRKISKKTESEYRDIIDSLFAFSGDMPIDHEIVNHYLYHLRDEIGLGGYRVTLHRTVVGMFLAFCAKFRYVDVSPMRWVTFPAMLLKPRTIRYSHDEFQRMRAVASLPMRAAITLSYRCGLRLIDIIYLMWSSIDLDRGTIIFEPIKTKRMGTVCRIMIPPDSDLMQDLIELRTFSSTERVFECLGTDPSWMRTRLQSINKKARVKHLGWHAMRRSCISNMSDAGVNPIEIMKIVGIRSLQTLQRYMSPSDAALLNAMKRGIEYSKNT